MAQERCVIIHADDAGMARSVNRATIEAMECGAVTSASIMMPCPWAYEIARYAADHPERDFGVHLTLTSEWPRYRWGPLTPRERVPSLVDAEGYFWRTNQQVARHARASDVALEWLAQVERARQFGVQISHLDSHMDVGVCRRDLTEVYADLASRYQVPALFVRREGNPPEETGYLQAASVAEERGLPMLASLHQFYFPRPYEERKALYLDALRTLPPGVSQILIHCGYDDDELRAITTSISIRDGDRRIVADPAFAAAIREYGIEPTTWKQLGALPRRGSGRPPGSPPTSAARTPPPCPHRACHPRPEASAQSTPEQSTSVVSSPTLGFPLPDLDSESFMPCGAVFQRHTR